MFALLILPILISGFISLSLGPFQKLKLHRYDGQLLYLKAAKVGLRYFLVVVVLSFYFKDSVIRVDSTLDLFGLLDTPIHVKRNIDPSLVTLVSKAISKSKNEVGVASDTLEAAWLISLSILTVLLSYFCQLLKIFKIRVQNMLANKRIALRRPDNDIVRISMFKRVLEDSPIDYMFYESFRYRKAILVTLKSRKVYVGIVNKLGEPNESKEPNQEISLVTAISGYRDKDSLEVNFTNDYNQCSEHDSDSVAIGRESIQILRLEQIDSVCWYHGDTFEQVNGNMSKNDDSSNTNSVSNCDDCKDKVRVKLGRYHLVKD